MTDAELQDIADETGETVETVRDLADAMAVCAAEGTDEARADRSQRAREAGLDGIADPTKYTTTVAKAVEAAVETAIRVRVDADVTHAAREAGGYQVPVTTKELKSMIEAAFEAAGFEVEQ
jgi:hypothetical protein